MSMLVDADGQALAGMTPAIKTYSFTATLNSNGACFIPDPPADLHFVLGLTYSGGGYVYYTVGTVNGKNTTLMLINSDYSKMTGTFDFTIAYI